MRLLRFHSCKFEAVGVDGGFCFWDGSIFFGFPAFGAFLCLLLAALLFGFFLLPLRFGLSLTLFVAQALVP
ncbi:MAG: hypothetical protein JO150_00310 [Acidobacteriaceae bacterium]|nr:hypothetical protein [Acidobacteriaceae bacterium]